VASGKKPDGRMSVAMENSADAGHFMRPPVWLFLLKPPIKARGTAIGRTRVSPKGHLVWDTK
jgi:hypothetical protein